MGNLIFIFINIILPIFIQIAAGYILQKKFTLNIGTMSKIQFYILIPALLFAKVYETELTKEIFLSIMLSSLIIFFTLYLLSFTIGKVFKFPANKRSSFLNSVVFYNSGNYCIPLIQLLYNNSFAFSVQIIIMLTQSILTNTLGVFSSSVGDKGKKHALLQMLKMPMIYSVSIAFICRAFKIPVWPPVWNAMDILSQGLVPLALLTLGAQLANTKISFKIPMVYFSNFVRLIVSPCVAWGIVSLIGLSGIVAQVIIICTAAPTAVNTVLLAIEYDNEPEFAAQIVFLSTIFSAITVSMVVNIVTKFV